MQHYKCGIPSLRLNTFCATRIPNRHTKFLKQQIVQCQISSDKKATKDEDEKLFQRFENARKGTTPTWPGKKKDAYTEKGKRRLKRKKMQPEKALDDFTWGDLAERLSDDDAKQSAPKPLPKSDVIIDFDEEESTSYKDRKNPKKAPLFIDVDDDDDEDYDDDDDDKVYAFQSRTKSSVSDRTRKGSRELQKSDRSHQYDLSEFKNPVISYGDKYEERQSRLATERWKEKQRTPYGKRRDEREEQGNRWEGRGRLSRKDTRDPQEREERMRANREDYFWKKSLDRQERKRLQFEQRQAEAKKLAAVRDKRREELYQKALKGLEDGVVPEKTIGQKGLAELDTKRRRALRKFMVPREPTYAELLIEPTEIARLTNEYMRIKPPIKIGRRGVAEGIIDQIHAQWNSKECVKVRIDHKKRYSNLRDVRNELEARTGGLVVWNSGWNFLVVRPPDWQKFKAQMSPFGVTWDEVKEAEDDPTIGNKAKEQLKEDECAALLQSGKQMDSPVEVGRRGVTSGLIHQIYSKWRVWKCLKVVVYEDDWGANMNLLHKLLEDRTDGIVVGRQERCFFLARPIIYSQYKDAEAFREWKAAIVKAFEGKENSLLRFCGWDIKKAEKLREEHTQKGRFIPKEEREKIEKIKSIGGESIVDDTDKLEAEFQEDLKAIRGLDLGMDKNEESDTDKDKEDAKLSNRLEEKADLETSEKVNIEDYEDEEEDEKMAIQFEIEFGDEDLDEYEEDVEDSVLDSKAKLYDDGEDDKEDDFEGVEIYEDDEDEEDEDLEGDIDLFDSDEEDDYNDQDANAKLFDMSSKSESSKLKYKENNDPYNDEDIFEKALEDLDNVDNNDIQLQDDLDLFYRNEIRPQEDREGYDIRPDEGNQDGSDPFDLPPLDAKKSKKSFKRANTNKQNSSKRQMSSKKGTIKK